MLTFFFKRKTLWKVGGVDGRLGEGVKPVEEYVGEAQFLGGRQSGPAAQFGCSRIVVKELKKSSNFPPVLFYV